MPFNIEDPLPAIVEHKDAGEIEETIFKLRKDLKIYNSLQYKLMVLKYGSRENADEHFEDWQMNESEKFEEAFYEIVREMMFVDPDFIDKLRQPNGELIQNLEHRLAILHRIEEQLSLHFSLHGKGNADLDLWRADHNKKLMKIIHQHPELVDEFRKSEDRAPEEQEVALAKIEELLY